MKESMQRTLNVVAGVLGGAPVALAVFLDEHGPSSDFIREQSHRERLVPSTLYNLWQAV